ncbi:MAG: FkbM family methyltransferase [Phycisphaerales bacterium]
MAGEWMFMNPMLRPLALVWGRLELPKWRGVLNRVAGWNHLHDAPRKRVKGKLHGFWMDLDLADWSDRWVYFLGRYYEGHTQLLFQLALRPGDTFVDIGANIGMTTLCAAALVRPEGRIVSFEPNPRVFERLKGHVAANGLESIVELRNRGVADAPGELELHVPRHTGQASFALVHEEQPTEVHRVPVGVGDDELKGVAGGPMFIKIDVEGYECRVLQGLKGTLASRRPAVMTEVLPKHLIRAGSSVEELFALMHGLGYEAYNVEYTDALWGWPGTLALRRLAGPQAKLSDDLLWLAKGSEHERRLGDLIVR